MRTVMVAAILQLAIALPAASDLTFGSLEATHGSGTHYRFPLVEGDSVASARINTFLQTQELGKLPGHYRENAFEDVWPQGSSGGTTNIDYRTAFPRPGIVSFEILSESYGAYPSSDSRTYHFDARTGEPLRPRSLFTKQGLAELDASITEERLRVVDDFLAGKAVQSGTRLRTEPEDAADQKELYQQCRASIAQGHPVEDDEFGIQEKSLSWSREPCAPHALLALDDLVFRDQLDLAALTDRLSDYGRCLLIERGKDCKRSHDGIGAGVYRGKIGGRYAITLVVQSVDFDGRVNAAYYYDKYAQAISLRGGVGEGGRVRLEEKGPPPARFELRRQPDGGVQGEWAQEAKAPEKVELQ